MPRNEAARLTALHECRFLDTFAGETYDDIVCLVAQVCRAPIAAVTLLDADRLWIKASYGIEGRETHRDLSFCAHTILGSDLMVVRDAAQDPRFKSHPHVTGEAGIRFYAGMPLITEDGCALGALCVADYRLRRMQPQQKTALRLLARQVTSQLEAVRRRADHDRLICERERAEWELSRLGAIVESAEDAILAATLDGTIVAWNKGAERLYGYLAADMMGQHTSALVDPNQENPFPAVLARLRRGKAVAPMEVRRTRKDGTELQVALSFSPIHNSSGHMVGLSCIARDITARKATEAALAESKARLVEAQRVARIGSWGYDFITDKITWSDELFHLFERKPILGEPTVEGLRSYYHPDDWAMHQTITQQAMRDGLPYEFDIRLLRRDGTVRWAHAVGRGERDTEGRMVRIFGTLMDIHERKLAEERFRVLFEHSSDGQLFVDEGGILDCNPAAVALLGYSDKSQLIALHPPAFSPPFQYDGRCSQEKSAEMAALARTQGSHRFEWVHRRKNGEEFPVEVTLTAVTLAGRSVLLSIWHDLTERRQAEEKIRDHAVVLEFQKGQIEASAELETLAATDGLTGLKNRRAFEERLTSEVSRSARYSTPLSLILLDVDKFKSYNDTHGHPAGDAVLRTVADVLHECARDTDLAARYGGEEFVLILPQTDLDGAAAFAERLRDAIKHSPWPMQDVTASFGVASLRLTDEVGAALIARADEALYQSKAAGRNRVTSAQQTLPSHAPGQPVPKNH